MKVASKCSVNWTVVKEWMNQLSMKCIMISFSVFRVAHAVLDWFSGKCTSTCGSGVAHKSRIDGVSGNLNYPCPVGIYRPYRLKSTLIGLDLKGYIASRGNVLHGHRRFRSFRYPPRMVIDCGLAELLGGGAHSLDLWLANYSRCLNIHLGWLEMS